MQFTQALTAPLTSSLTEAISAYYGGSFNPSTLFASATGYVYDLNDLTTVFQDSAGTVAGNDSLYEVAA